MSSLLVTNLVLSGVVGVLLASLWRVTIQLRRFTAPTRPITIAYASGALPPPPFDLDLAGQRLIVVAVDGETLTVRDREWHDTLSLRWRAIARWAKERVLRVTDRWSRS